MAHNKFLSHSQNQSLILGPESESKFFSVGVRVWIRQFSNLKV